MGVLLGLRDVQLATALAGDDLRQRRCRSPWRKGDRVRPALLVLGERRQRDLRRPAARELVESRLRQRPDELPGAVGPEVEMDHDVAVIHAVVVADHRRTHELVGLPRLVRRRDRLGAALGPDPLGVHDRVVRQLRPLPASIPVHRVVATADRADPAGLPQPSLELLQVTGRRSRQRVPAVGERVHDEIRNPLLGGELDQRLDVLPSRVHPAVGDEPHEVQTTARRAPGRFAGGEQGLVLEERPVRDRVVDPREVLLHHRAGAQVQVPDLGVPHLAVRQPDVAAAGRELRVGIRAPELVEDRRVGLRDRVAGTGGSEPPAVEDDQRQRRDRGPGWAGRNGHAASQIARKSPGSRLAPPTSAPSISSRPSRSAALSGFTDPP